VFGGGRRGDEGEEESSCVYRNGVVEEDEAVEEGGRSEVVKGWPETAVLLSSVVMAGMLSLELKEENGALSSRTLTL
jgi:hypothetical protein